MTLEEEIRELKLRVAELESLTMHLRPLGPSPARDAELEKDRERIVKALVESAPQPVDRSQRVLTDGSPVPEDQSHAELREDGQQKGYVVLSASERARGFVRPYRDAYRHVGPPGPQFSTRDLTDEEKERYKDVGYVKFEAWPPTYKPSSTGRYWTQEQLDRVGKGCGKITTMGRSIAETYARDPHFYSGTFCSNCRTHFYIGEGGEFVWYEMDGTTGPRVGT